jgi:hypothetical protein
VALLRRLRTWAWQLLLSFDQLGLLLIQLFTYVLLARGGVPNCDETISSKVGRNAAAGKRWAIVAEKVINTLLWFDPDHCRSSIGS